MSYGQLSLLYRIPGLRSLYPHRSSADKLFRAIDADGILSASAVTYRHLKLADFRTAVTITNCVIRLSHATFRSGGGQGGGQLEVDMTARPAHIAGIVSLAQVNVQAATARLPPVP